VCVCVAVFGNNVEATFDFVTKNGNNVERVLRCNFVLSTNWNVASTLLLVWNRLKKIRCDLIDATMAKTEEKDSHASP